MMHDQFMKILDEVEQRMVEIRSLDALYDKKIKAGKGEPAELTAVSEETKHIREKLLNHSLSIKRMLPDLMSQGKSR